ncbi:GroES-like protein [Calocera viscosa TUFC12733]|uniref:GroES-like protein n=1 Tax=Calocera viscosa (strain TUFC12733) TaxID=1330018 RepID=A0A167NKC9_CALVF|nr:GroES-like protein [Calocera viscosa TUFC12733]
MATKTMKAVTQSAFGEPAKVLKVDRVPLPAFDESSSELLVQVKAVSVNPLDYIMVKGTLKFLFNTPMPAVIGADLSGVVAKAGKGTGFKEGDEVYGLMSMKSQGSLAEYCIVPARNVALKPKSLSHEEASCMPITGLTAVQAFQRHSGPKDTAFIPAGLGGVGSVMLQLAKPYAGFKRTITTASTAKVELVKKYIQDVDEVIDYKKVDPATVIPAHSCDFVLDQFGKPSEYVRYVRKPAPGNSAQGKPSIISIVTPPNAEKCQEGWEIRVNPLLRIGLNLMDWTTRLRIPNWIHFDSFFALAISKDLQTLAELADQGKVRPVIDKVFPIEQAVEAILLAESKPAGKVVIRISD